MDLPCNDPISFALLRAVHRACGLKLLGLHLYTDAERRQGLRDLILCTRTKAAISKDLGISERCLDNLATGFSTLFRKEACSLKAMKTAFSQAPAHFDYLLSLFQLPKLGPTYLVSDEGNKLIVIMAGVQKAAGLGMDRRSLGAFYMDYTQDPATRAHQTSSRPSAQTSSRPSAQTSSQPCAQTSSRPSTQISSQPSWNPFHDHKFVTRNSIERVVTDTAESFTDAKASFSKDSNLDVKRAIAGNPILDSAMKSAIENLYADLFAQGILKTPHPLPHQVWNGDEIGFDPNGSFLATYGYTSGGTPPRRSFRLHSGERAPFWVTMFFMSRADGQHPIPPTIVHQGGDEHSLRGDLSLELNADWVVHSTPSGYMDQAGFRAVVHNLIKFCGSAPDNPQFLFVDGHDSHWDAASIKALRDNYIYLIFLKAHDSTNDQPNDLGNNAQVKVCYCYAVNRWRRFYAGAVSVLSPAYFNRIIGEGEL
jgi:hypothetical protein